MSDRTATSRRRARRPSGGAWACAVVSCIVLASVARASAQSTELEAGIAAYDRAEFATAIRRIDGALSTETLPAAEVERGLDRVAAAAFAIGDDAALERALTHLALVAPEHAFGLDVPPPLVERFAALLAGTTPIAIAFRTDASAGGHGPFRVHASVGDDPTAAVRALVLSCGAGGAEHEARGAAPEVTAAAGETCQAAAIGPGGVELVTARLTLDAAPPPSPASGPDPLVLGLGIGGGALALAIIIGVSVGVASSSPSGDVQLALEVVW